MIYYFTALVISYSMTPDTTTKAFVWYDREYLCQDAMNKGAADQIYSHLYELYDDLEMKCIVSDKISYTLRPRLRGED